jgi:predicted Zn-dependent protease
VTKTDSLELLEKVLKVASADSVTASLSGDDSLSTRVADNIITQNVRSSSVTLHVECAYGQSHGAASTDDLSDDSLRQAVQRAQEIAKVSPPDPEFMPPVEASEAAKYPNVKGFFDSTAGATPQQKGQQIAKAAQKVQARGMRFSGGYPSNATFRALANSAGLRGHTTRTQTDIHATVLGANGSGWHEILSSDIAEIDVDGAVSKALDIAERAQEPHPLEAGKYDVILSPAAIGELLLYTLFVGLDAKATDEGRTYLRGKLGTKICGENINIRSDPTNRRCPGSPFQGDGLVSPALPWIEKGVAKNLCYSRFWAKKQGKPATGWPSNVLMDGGNATLDQMIASIQRGLLVTRFWYIRYVDPMVPLFTGMTRDGLFLIEGGKITRPVQNMRFNENSIDVLNRVEMLGPCARTGEYMQMLMPLMKVRDFNFTSTTKF